MKCPPITAEDIKRLLQAVPFAPFTMHLSNGEKVPVRQADNALVSKRHITVGVAPDPATGIPDHDEMIALLHVVKLEAGEFPEGQLI